MEKEKFKKSYPKLYNALQEDNECNKIVYFYGLPYRNRNGLTWYELVTIEEDSVEEWKFDWFEEIITLHLN